MIKSWTARHPAWSCVMETANHRFCRQEIDTYLHEFLLYVVLWGRPPRRFSLRGHGGAWGGRPTPPPRDGIPGRRWRHRVEVREDSARATGEEGGRGGGFTSCSFSTSIGTSRTSDLNKHFRWGFDLHHWVFFLFVSFRLPIVWKRNLTENK